MAGNPPAIASRITSMRLEAAQLRTSLERRRLDDERLKQVLASYTVRVEVAPKLESELTQLMRDYDTLQGRYASLLAKSEDAKLAASLERRQVGEQFRIVDGARLSERPTSPDRVRLNLMGLLGGLAFGLLIVGFVEYRDTTFKSDDDVVVSLALPVIAVIPTMTTAFERHRINRRKILLGVSASILLLVSAAGVIAWRLELFQAWVR
jgi:hypothetical protein